MTPVMTTVAQAAAESASAEQATASSVAATVASAQHSHLVDGRTRSAIDRLVSGRGSSSGRAQSVGRQATKTKRVTLGANMNCEQELVRVQHHYSAHHHNHHHHNHQSYYQPYHASAATSTLQQHLQPTHWASQAQQQIDTGNSAVSVLRSPQSATNTPNSSNSSSTTSSSNLNASHCNSNSSSSPSATGAGAAAATSVQQAIRSTPVLQMQQQQPPPQTPQQQQPQQSASGQSMVSSSWWICLHLGPVMATQFQIDFQSARIQTCTQEAPLLTLFAWLSRN